MAFRIIVSPKVDWDIEDALDYYGEFSEKAKKSFKTQLSDCYKKLRKNPWFQKKYGNVRALPFKKYPYLVLFEVDETAKTVYIISVFCTHQNPEKYP